MLYLVATPIGNLSDFPPRAVEVLANSSLVLCEDTRHSLRLFKAYEISVPLLSYHKFSEAARKEKVLSLLNEGKTVSLVTDAGTPCLSDPGQLLVEACHEAGIPVSGVPGPCAAIFALSLSGFAAEPFQFLGFAPRKQGERERWIRSFLFYPGTTVVYESPDRVLSLLSFLKEWISDRRIACARELTKQFEEVLRGTPEALHSHFSNKAPRGEFVVLIEGTPTQSQEAWEALSAEEHVAWLEETFPLSRRDAIALAAEMRGARKRDLYFLRKND